MLWPFIETKTVKETFCFPTMIFSRQVLEIFWNFSRKKEKVRLLTWERLFWHKKIALLQENIQNALFSVQCEKKIKPKLLCRRTDIPQKAERSLLKVSGTLFNKSSRGIKHNLFVKSICIHIYCPAVSSLETVGKYPFWKHGIKGVNSKIHLLQRYI